MFFTRQVILIVSLLMLCALPALGDTATTATELPPLEARDITLDCTLNGYTFAQHQDPMRDHNYGSFWTSYMQEGVHCLKVASSEGVGGVLVRWRTPAPLAVQVLQEGEWITVAQSEQDYAALYLEIPGLTEFRLVNRDNPRKKLEISEITLLSEGKVPGNIQVWQEPTKQVDLMLLSAHPDDEVLWFGGLLPYYAIEREKECLVVCFAYNAYNRRLELLDSLWTCGVRDYPVFAGYIDYYTSSLLAMYQYWDRSGLYMDVAQLYREYKPQVVVAHDLQGEYGHGAHRAVSDAAQKAVALAADPGQHVASVQLFGTWEVPKVYIHLWEENALTMDWQTPLASMGGKSPQEIAREAYKCHASQQRKQWAVEDGGKYDNSRFGLFFTNVGLDVEKNDLFEHIK